MLKTSKSTESTTRLGKGRVWVVGDGGGDGSETLTSRLRTSSSTDSSTNATQIVIEFDGVDAGDGGGGKSSKSCQKVEESSKSPKSRKNCKSHWFGGIFTKAPTLRHVHKYKELKLTSEL